MINNHDDNNFPINKQLACSHDPDRHCLTCSDEAVEVIVVDIDTSSGLAHVQVNEQVEEVDISLIEQVTLGDTLLVHGGVAIQKID
jgi:hypothetical protein